MLIYTLISLFSSFKTGTGTTFKENVYQLDARPYKITIPELDAPATDPQMKVKIEKKLCTDKYQTDVLD